MRVGRAVATRSDLLCRTELHASAKNPTIAAAFGWIKMVLLDLDGLIEIALAARGGKLE